MGRLRRTGTFSGRSAAPRRQIFNQGITGEVDGVTTVVGVVKVVGSIGVANGEAPVTLVRTRGRWEFSVASVSALGIDRCVMGIMIVSADAFNIGVTALPGPLSDIENDWIVWEPLINAHTSSQAEGDIRSFDSRGMRKLKLGDVLAVMFEIESDVAGTIYDIGYAFRQQFKT